MASRVRKSAAPAYLFLCLLLGGSGQGVWANMILQLLGLGLIAWAAVAEPRRRTSRAQTHIWWLAVLALVFMLAQLVPLPPAVWRHFGAGDTIADGYRVLGIPLPWLPLSVAPYDSLASLLAIIPGLAMLVVTIRFGCKLWSLTAVLLAGAVAGILLGALQVSSANPELSPWYLYADTNFGAATGFFANANHMADLLVVTLPFLAAALAQSGDRERTPQQHSAALVMFAGAVLVIAVGIALNGSLAGYGLAIPVLAASALIAFPARRLSRWLAPAAAILFIAAIGWLSTTPLSTSQQLSSTASSSVQSRREILATSLKATGDLMPFGSGIGTFQRVYALHEDHDRLNPTIYVNHAHNDYIEMALEMGLPGVILIGLFLLWWARAAWTKWPTKSRDPYARAAVVASAAMLLHSVVDFPLRTAALSACFAMCLALLSRPKREPRKDKSRLWATRHVVIE